MPSALLGFSSRSSLDEPDSGSLGRIKGVVTAAGHIVQRHHLLLGWEEAGLL